MEQFPLKLPVGPFQKSVEKAKVVAVSRYWSRGDSIFTETNKVSNILSPELEIGVEGFCRVYFLLEMILL